MGHSRSRVKQARYWDYGGVCDLRGHVRPVVRLDTREKSFEIPRAFTQA